jgi:outer membrane protein assembly factor BamE (lipoprotein component of BamABCDE complex)
MWRNTTILLSFGLLVGCSSDEDRGSDHHVRAQVAPASDFETQIRSIRLGMTKTQVEKALGRPDDIQTPEDHAGTWTVGTSETWSYGAEAHRAFAKKGAVYFDKAGRVQYVYGSLRRLQPPE